MRRVIEASNVIFHEEENAYSAWSADRAGMLARDPDASPFDDVMDQIFPDQSNLDEDTEGDALMCDAQSSDHLGKLAPLSY